ncbi:transposase, partial [Puniceicoccaceae bacterium K14]|nr:transposase [Puniceicoccaceae bacterium K14]
LKGFAWLTATVIAAELGDMRRFPNARSMMCYLGLTTTEHTSGNRRRQGGISKAGNSHARFFLVESAQHYYKTPKVSAALTERQKDVEQAIKDISWKAQSRLHKRYWSLTHRGVMTQKIQVAIARELVGFVWAIGQRVEIPATKN